MPNILAELGIARLPTPITPRATILPLRDIPTGDGLRINRTTTSEQGFPDGGQTFFMNQRVTFHIPIGDFEEETQVWGALRCSQYLDPTTVFSNHLVTVVTEDAQKLIEGSAYFRRWPIIPAGLLKNILDLDKLNKYGIVGDIGTQMGALYLQGLVFDRAVRSTLLDFYPDWDVLYPIYPKGKSGKQPVRLADALVNHPSSFYAQMVTTADLNKGVSLFPPREMESSENPGGLIYSAFTRDDLWPTHRVMGRREFFDHVPLATGEHVQNLLTVLAAIDLAAGLKDKGVTIERVFDELGLQDAQLEPVGDMANDYNQVLTILHEVLFSNHKRLIDATAEDYQLINQKLRSTGNTRLGQLLPSLTILTGRKQINKDELTKARRYLFSKNWSGFSPELSRVLPADHRDSEALNTDILIETLQRMLDATSLTIQLPGETPGLPDPIIEQVRETMKRKIQITAEQNRPTETTDERITALIQSNMASWLTDEISDALRTSDMFNVRDSSGSKINFSPQSPEMQFFFKQGELYIATHDIVALMPFHQEKATARSIYDYLTGLFPKNRVITGGNDADTHHTFKDVDGGIVTEQDIILSFISPAVREALGLSQIPDWSVVEKDRTTGDLQRGIKNTKGDTVLSLVLTGIATGLIHPNTDLMLSDSDFENPEGENGYYAAHSLAGAKANQEPNKEAVMVNIGRLGPQRRNHSVQTLINTAQNLGTPLQRRVATNMNRLMWYLTGERVVKADLIMNHPFPNGYSMEVWLDLMASIEDYFNSDITIAQIAVTTRKILKDAKPSKDWAMTQYCAIMLEIFFKKWEDEVSKKFYTLTEDEQRELNADSLAYVEWEKKLRGKGVLPTEWKSETLRELNVEHAGRPLFITVPDEADEDAGEKHEEHNFGNMDYFIPRDMLRPSIADMDEMGWIDWEGMVEYIRNKGIPIDEQKLENAWWKQRQRERQQTQSAV